jgi:SAM-dependent methyltransferase
MRTLLRHALAHPLTHGTDIDDPATTELRRRIIAGKPFLRRLYADWYRAVAAALPAGAQPVLELGTGAGFLRDHVDGLITSDVMLTSNVRVVLDGARLPFPARSLRAIVLIDAFHHVARPRALLAEAARCLRDGGALVMLEPWVSRWSRFVYGWLHHEPFLPDAPTWEFPPSGPLSGANGALPWIVFQRDRECLEREFAALEIVHIEPMMPFAYLLSGGVSMRSLAPAALYGPCRFVERMLRAAGLDMAMFALIVIRRRQRPDNPACA